MKLIIVKGAIADRIEAMRKLQENPDDNDAMEQMNKAQQQLDEWNASGQAGMCYFLKIANDDSSDNIYFSRGDEDYANVMG